MISLRVLLVLLGIIGMGLWGNNFGKVLRGRLEPVIVSVLDDRNTLATKLSHTWSQVSW